MIRLPVTLYSKNKREPNKMCPTGWKIWWLVEAAGIVWEAVVVEVPSGPMFAAQWRW